MLHSTTKLAISKKTEFNHGIRCCTRQLLMFFCLNLFVQQSLAAESITEPESSIKSEISALLTAKQHTYLTQSNFLHRTDDLEKLYKMAGYQLLWLGHSNPEKNIAEVLHLFDTAAV